MSTKIYAKVYPTWTVGMLLDILKEEKDSFRVGVAKSPHIRLLAIKDIDSVEPEHQVIVLHNENTSPTYTMKDFRTNLDSPYISKSSLIQVEVGNPTPVWYDIHYIVKSYENIILVLHDIPANQQPF